MNPFEQDREDNKWFIRAELIAVGIAFTILAALAAVSMMCTV